MSQTEERDSNQDTYGVKQQNSRLIHLMIDKCFQTCEYDQIIQKYRKLCKYASQYQSLQETLLAIIQQFKQQMVDKISYINDFNLPADDQNVVLTLRLCNSVTNLQILYHYCQNQTIYQLINKLLEKEKQLYKKLQLFVCPLTRQDKILLHNSFGIITSDNFQQSQVFFFEPYVSAARDLVGTIYSCTPAQQEFYIQIIIRYTQQNMNQDQMLDFLRKQKQQYLVQFRENLCDLIYIIYPKEVISAIFPSSKKASFQQITEVLLQLNQLDILQLESNICIIINELLQLNSEYSDHIEDYTASSQLNFISDIVGVILMKLNIKVTFNCWFSLNNILFQLENKMKRIKPQSYIELYKFIEIQLTKKTYQNYVTFCKNEENQASASLNSIKMCSIICFQENCSSFEKLKETFNCFQLFIKEILEKINNQVNELLQSKGSKFSLMEKAIFKQDLKRNEIIFILQEIRKIQLVQSKMKQVCQQLMFLLIKAQMVNNNCKCLAQFVSLFDNETEE